MQNDTAYSIIFFTDLHYFLTYGSFSESGGFMYVFLILFFASLVLSILLLKRNSTGFFLIVMLLSFFVVTFDFMTYLCKDNCYYNSVYQYLILGQGVQNYLILLPVSRWTLARLFNVFSILFLYSSLCFSLFFSLNITFRTFRGKLLLLSIPCALQILLYDPAFYRAVYYRLYPDVMSSNGVVALYSGIHSFTCILNALYALAGIGLILYAYFSSPKIKQIRNYILLIFVSFFSVAATYWYMNYWAPDILIRISKVADYESFYPLNLTGDPFMYRLLPHITVLCIFLNVFALYRYARVKSMIRNKNGLILQNFDSASLAVRVFCHYMKNELLGIVSQTEELEEAYSGTPGLAEGVSAIRLKCEKIYARLDDVHKNTVKSKLSLKLVPADALIRDALRTPQVNPDKLKLNLRLCSPAPYILADDYYFSQAVQNIIINAAESMAARPPAERKLDISVEVKNKWVELTVADCGVGIAQENLNRIFNPFFSSKPTSQNWGMGLSLSHTIITAHGGKILVDSEPGTGSTFRIVLPFYGTYQPADRGSDREDSYGPYHYRPDR